MTRLVLTRKIDEEIIISNSNSKVVCSIAVSKIDRNNVRLSFEAEPDLRIDRKEVFESKYGKQVTKKES
jgi:carbon storage regulator CsrA